QGEASFSAQRPQTTYFAHQDSDITQRNKMAVAELVQKVGSEAFHGSDAARVCSDVGVNVVLAFLSAYSFHDKSELRSNLLVDYVREQNRHGALGEWNVAFVGRKNPSRVAQVGLSPEPALITRSQLGRRKGDQVVPDRSNVANIGTLMSRPDRVIDLLPPAKVRAMKDKDMQDLRDESGRGLLLVYPIDKDSVPRPGLRNRLGLDAVDDLFGVALSFPTADPQTEPTDTIQVDLSKLTEAEIEEENDDTDSYEDAEGDHDVDLG
ncbi:MAG: hypothetical protein WBH03_24185, partial [Cyclobacteriaceae bacterium]